MGELETLQVGLMIALITVGSVVMFFSGIVFIYNRDVQPILARSRVLIWTLYITEVAHLVWYPLRYFPIHPVPSFIYPTIHRAIYSTINKNADRSPR